MYYMHSYITFISVSKALIGDTMAHKIYYKFDEILIQNYKMILN